MHEKALILDTCALLWLASEDAALSATARRSIESASIVYVSAISSWEISLKVSQGSLVLPLEPLEWFTQVLKKHNLVVAPLDVDILVMANELPWHHKDPADRFIIATAKRKKITVVTTDKRFVDYGVNVII